MPRHAVFLEDYGRSSRYSIGQRNRGRPDLNINNEAELDRRPASSSESSLSDSEGDQIPNPNEADANPADPPQHAMHIDNDEIREDEDLGRESDTDDGRGMNFDDEVQFVIDDDSDSDLDNEEVNHGNRPVYERAPITLSESMISILVFTLCYNVTGTALDGLLGLLSLHCVRPNHLKKSLYSFRKYFKKIQYPLVKHYFCTECFSSLVSSEAICEVCGDETVASYFLEIPIIEQLKTLFERPGFHDKLQYRFRRQKENPDSLEDLFDGEIYQGLAEILSSSDNISFQWNTDGVTIFKSSGFSIWPFYISINELPPSDRKKPENMILGALWFGPHKPQPNLFLSPLYSVFRTIYNGIHLSIPGREAPVLVRGIILNGTCDLPAKALFLNMTQFNGKYGCPKCTLRGRSVDGVWTYPFEPNLSIRTEEDTRDFAEEALQDSNPVFGIKGYSMLSTFVYKFIRTTAVDSMHCVFAGVVKKLCQIWFDEKYGHHPATLRCFIDLVDARLCALSPPLFLQRRPRSLKRHLKYWKANELKAWFFYYSLPILCDIMRPDYFEHYSMFVLAIFILHKSSVSHQMVDKASKLLFEFVNRFDVLYGERYMSCNLHQLLHLPDTVRDFGPLWTSTCFPYEDLNGKLKVLVHSSNRPELQICHTIAMFINLTSLMHKHLEYDTPAWEFCNKHSRPNKRRRYQAVADGIRSVGKTTRKLTLSAIVQRAFARAAIQGTKYEQFSRIMNGNVLYTAECYFRQIRYNNTCAQYHCNGLVSIGIIDSFIKVFSCVCEAQNGCECHVEMYAIVRKCSLSPLLPEFVRQDAPDFLFQCTSISKVAIAINAQQLLSVCAMSKIGDVDTMYVALTANTVEAE